MRPIRFSLVSLTQPRPPGTRSGRRRARCGAHRPCRESGRQSSVHQAGPDRAGRPGRGAPGTGFEDRSRTADFYPEAGRQARLPSGAEHLSGAPGWVPHCRGSKGAAGGAGASQDAACQPQAPPSEPVPAGPPPITARRSCSKSRRCRPSTESRSNSPLPQWFPRRKPRSRQPMKQLPATKCGWRCASTGRNRRRRRCCCAGATMAVCWCRLSNCSAGGCACRTPRPCITMAKPITRSMRCGACRIRWMKPLRRWQWRRPQDCLRRRR